MTTVDQLRSFDELFAIAAARKGGADAFEQTLASPRTERELARIPDDRWLSEMSKRAFQAGFSWKVVADKWPRFEVVFEGFDLGRMSMMSDDDLDRYLRTEGIIRHGKKILSIRDNAVFLRELASEYGTAAAAFAEWPSDNFAGLVWMLKKRASRMGGISAMYFLRGMGVDSYVLAGDVVKALIREGVVDKPPSSKRDMDLVQAGFNRWHAESGRPLTHISRVLACSID
ncbi:MAG: DNA-3-methyladenine glycosylase I [Geminicoccaceae bacterium]